MSEVICQVETCEWRKEEEAASPKGKVDADKAAAREVVAVCRSSSSPRLVESRSRWAFVLLAQASLEGWTGCF